MRLRIKCKAPPLPPPDPRFGLVVMPLPGIGDCEVVAVDDAGLEHRIECVTAIRWGISAGDTSEVHIEVAGAELDVEEYVRSKQQREG